MYGKILEYIKEWHMLDPGDRVVIGLSGGADSVCLLLLLHQWRRELKIELFAVHVHHGLRGREADRDSSYAEELSEGLGVPFICVGADVGKYARAHGLSLEEAGRLVRYRALEEERKRLSAQKIAVAHHGDDQVETVLYNLFRGSGLTGLCGMRPVRDAIIRPLLCVEKREILAYLEEKGISYCQDSSNASTDYVRNRLRLEIIPAIRERINPGAPLHIRMAAETAAAADGYFEEEALRILDRYGVTGGNQTAPGESGKDRSEMEAGAETETKTGAKAGAKAGVEVEHADKGMAVGIPVEALAAREPIIRQYVIRRMIGMVLHSLKNVSFAHIEATEALLFKPVGRRIQLPGGVFALRTYGELWICGVGMEPSLRMERSNTQKIPTMSVFSYKKGQEIPKNRYTKWFDYDKINSTLSVRHRETGDYITLAGGSRKSVKAFMIDEKIPREERDGILLVADGSHILWIIGYRISEYYKIKEDTQTVLQICCD